MAPGGIRLILAGAALALGGCGTDAEDVSQEWVRALNQGDYQRACELTSEKTRDLIGAPPRSATCEDYYAEQPFGTGLRLDDVRRDRFTAAPAKPPEGLPERIRSRWTGVVVDLSDGHVDFHPDIAVIR